MPFDLATRRVTGAVKVLGSDARIETGRGSAQLAVSHGTIAFAPGPRMFDGVLLRVDRAGRVDSVPGEPANYTALSLSPDGSRIAVTVRTTAGATELRIIEPVSGRSTVWLSDRTSITALFWLPDGKRILFRRRRSWWVGSPDLTVPPDSLAGAGAAVAVRFLADSKRYVARYGDDSLAIRGEPADRPLVRSMPWAGGDMPVVTGDDRWLIMMESRGQRSEVTAKALDGSGRRVHLADVADMYQQEWPVGGSEVIMVREDGGVVSVPYHAGAAEPFGAPVLLFRTQFSDFPGRNYSVGLAGQRFIFKRGVPEQPLHEIRFVQEWQATLGSR
jgi:hypothetical protein